MFSKHFLSLPSNLLKFNFYLFIIMKYLYLFFSNVKNIYDGILTLQSLCSRIVYLLGDLLTKVESININDDDASRS